MTKTNTKTVSIHSQFTIFMSKAITLLALMCCSSFSYAKPFTLDHPTKIVKADKAYTSGSLTTLGRIYQANPKNRVIQYLYAKGMLTKNVDTPALNFVSHSSDDYMKANLLHQLLIYYFNNQDYKGYIGAFNQLGKKHTYQSERCGYEIATIKQNLPNKNPVDNNWLTHNRIPTWCAKLAAVKFLNHKINLASRNLMLFNLVANHRTDTFNEIVPTFGMRPINFYRYRLSRLSRYSKNRNFQYIAVRLITKISHKKPELALAIMKKHKQKLDKDTQVFLTNYLALQFAVNHDFAIAAKLFEKNDNTNLSNIEYEWQARSYLFLLNWDKLIDTINHMPDRLQQKPTWLYWIAYSEAQLGHSLTALELYKQLPDNLSYYSILAKNALGKKITFKTNPKFVPQNTQNATTMNFALSLYLLAKNVRSRNLANLASREWRYAAKLATDDELLAMSMLAQKEHIYQLSIYAANQMDSRYIELSFPMPFLANYSKYGNKFGIDKSYPLAVTRQESRFNYTVIAFDGGVGLMQIMPRTARYIAHKAHYRLCYRKTFDCNIKFGSWYLSSLFHKFNNNYIYTTAAYNAGPNRARRWQDKLGDLPNTLQMELVPIHITRNYVKRVLTNKAVYDARLANKSSFDVLTYINKLDNKHYLNIIDDDHTDAGKL